MLIPVQITLRGLSHSEALDSDIRKRCQKLEHVHSHIVSCRVVVELAARHKQHGRQFEIHLDVKVPGGEIAVTREHAEDVGIAVREAFDAATRQLSEHARKLRGDVKSHG
jgi:ribosome-associated translation inhibitor RaiA